MGFRQSAAALLVVSALAGGALASELDSKFELFVTDPAESTRFYATLGFDVAQRKPDGYTTLRNGRVVVALSPVP